MPNPTIRADEERPKIMADARSVAIVSPEDQGATFVELFFDLVFVFAITQVTHYAAHHLDLQGIGRAVMVFWLIWWAWTQFTWALNAANTDHQFVRVATLISTGVAFAMAFSVERAFAAERAEALWFALSYIGVRIVGLGLYYRVVHSNAARSYAVATFAGLSIAGLAAVFGGSLVDPSLRNWVWLAAIVLDAGAAWFVGGRRAWGLHAGHFAERHGLIVIIALGESLIVAGSALTSGATRTVLTTGAMAVLMICLLWWTYFGWIRGVLEEALTKLTDRDRDRLGRDAYTFWHFSLVSGIIALAVGLEGAFHPDDYTVTQVAVALGTGLTLFLISTAGALWRAVGCVLWNRLIVLAVTLGALALSVSSVPVQVLGVACSGLAVIIGIEQITVRRQLESG